MTTLATEIAKLVAAAKCLGAPTYGLDEFEQVARRLEKRKADRIRESGEMAPFVDCSDIDDDIMVLVEATYAAWSFVASRYLAAEIAAPLRGDLSDGVGKLVNDRVIAGRRLYQSLTEEDR